MAFLLFQSVTIKIFPYSYDFFWGGNISFFLFSSNQQRPQIFLVFFITYMSYSLHKKNRRCNKGKKLFHSHIHAHTYTLTTQSYPFGLSSPMYRKVPSPIRT